MRFTAEISLTVESSNLMPLPPRKFHYKTVFSLVEKKIAFQARKLGPDERRIGPAGRLISDVDSVSQQHLDLKRIWETRSIDQS